MKKFFEYAGLFVLTIFSFYYTDKLVKLTNEKDPIMKEIVEYASANNTKCVEGYVTSEGVVLGVSGSVVDEDTSYANMKGWGFNEDLLVFLEDACILNKEANVDDYIIKGNEIKNSVSLFIDVFDGTLLKDIVVISEAKKVKVNFLVTGKELETYKDYFNVLYNNGYDIIFNGSDKTDYEKYKTIMKNFNKKSNKYCYNNDLIDMLDLCSKDKINTIKTDKYYNKDLLLNTKNNLESGVFLIFKENEILLEELSSVINYIEAKGMKVVTLTEHLE